MMVSHLSILLLKGGDDRRILLWNVAYAMTSSNTSSVPVQMKAEHNSNIFCMAFSSSNSTIISGGNDSCILVHDVERYCQIGSCLILQLSHNATSLPGSWKQDEENWFIPLCYGFVLIHVNYIEST